MDAVEGVEGEDFMAALDSMAEAGEAIMADIMVVITACLVIAAHPVIGEDFSAMFPSWASEPDSLRVIGQMVITIPIRTTACAKDGFQPAAIKWKAGKTPIPALGKRFRCQMGIGKLSPAISSFKQSFFYLR